MRMDGHAIYRPMPATAASRMSSASKSGAECPGKGKLDGQATAFGVGCPDLAAVRLHNPTRYRQSQPQPSARRPLRPIELVEDARELAPGQALTMVDHVDHHVAVAIARSISTGCSLSECLSALSSRLKMACSISGDPYVAGANRWNFGAQHSPGVRSLISQRRPHNLLQTFPLLTDANAAALQARHVQQTAQQLIQALGLVVDDAPISMRAKPCKRSPCSTSVLDAEAMTASGARRSCDTELSTALRIPSVSASRSASASQ